MRYFISDTHFGHRNIIDYCDRPFSSTEEMDRHLRENWSRVVDDSDEVVFLGYLTIAGTAAAFLDWIERLHGDCVFMIGDHDHEVIRTLNGVSIHDQFQISIGDHDCYCVHQPKDAPSNWDGWVIYDHRYNKWPDEFPFVDPEAKRVNISVELLGYEPASVDGLCSYLDAETRLQRRPKANQRTNSQGSETERDRS